MAKVSKLKVEIAPQHRELGGWAGKWRGTTRTWLDPNPLVEPETSKTSASFEVLLGGLFVRETYEGVVAGEAHQGVRTYGFDKQFKKFTCSWIDNFHMSSAVMVLEGKRAGQGSVKKLTLLGHFMMGKKKVGWKKIIESPKPGQLKISQYMDMGRGVWFLGVETVLKRVR